MKTIRTLITLFMIAVILPLFAGEGMWLPLLLKALNEEEMQAMGMKMSAEDIYSVNQGSLKDAIVHFGGFCTSEIISDQGLLLTNHHCGYGAIQSHSTVDNNLLKNGFWAQSLDEELPNPNLFARFIVRIEDVTKAVFKKVKEDMTPSERQSAIDQNIERIMAQAEKEDYQEAFVRPFFQGNQYFLFVTETYRDVRLVGAPPESIGKFGADTDNWEWPRHTGDFSLFRIYAGPDNKPAGYAPENKPFKPKHFFPISLDGVEPGDFTLVFGFPGRTQQYLPGVAVKQVIEVTDPTRIGIRERSLAVMDKYMRQDESVRLQYASTFASIANGWKKWIGEKQGLEKTNALAEKAALEAEFLQRVNKKRKWKIAYGSILDDFKQYYQEIEPYEKASIYYSEIFGRNVNLFRLLSRLDRLKRIYENNGSEAFNDRKDAYRASIESILESYSSEIDQEICTDLLKHMSNTLVDHFIPNKMRREELFMRNMDIEKMVSWLYSESPFSTNGKLQQLMALEGPDFVQALNENPAYTFYQSVIEVSATEISPDYARLRERLNDLQKQYMKALMEVFPEKRFWPDANSTLRVTYGLVEGYAPRDAVMYLPVTYLDGVIEKYKPGDYEFDVHPRLLELYEQKDYGPYADRKSGKVPVCFLGSNHTSGGNSGSPAIDAYGNLIGINFDRVWEGTMSDIHYDRSICRNIMVDMRYVLFVVDKFAGATHLIDELVLVHPKTGDKVKK